MSDSTNGPVFYFDFASPNAYFAHRILPGVEARTGLKFRHVPVLLGGIFKSTGNQAPMIAFAGVPAKLAYEYKEIERFIARHDLQHFNFNPHFPVNTLALMRGAVAAEAEGVLEAYVEAMFHFMWEKPRKLDDADVLRATLTEAGLPAERLLAAIQTPEVKAQLMANTQLAVDQGVFGIPSFIVGGELYFGKDRLETL
ncbi:2-hydroxychromene-2-carboxylate isomerase [Maricaulis salignorans]|uniref:2-hydroxychromene-2-carboxylate isomerase n=1 Tax=Maricaulis salignorans TaxID=144026 RepID=A0A1G9T7M5_9PROT|nr:2-hydroxychromene-2-carboxylate isomerase [Maricaulis salignorans]SDM43630.1 2-hydroxychromene-2-carboxylate isomerase [Maricaulis salignorans]